MCLGALLTQGTVQSAEPARKPRFDPILKNIEGWKVDVDPALLEGKHQEEGAIALQMLANHLQRIKVLVPQPQLGKLQTIGIWIERAHPVLGNMQYHPGARWLKDHGHDPRLVKKVHITHASALLSRQQMLKHPAVILHELAHGYHDQILGFEHPDVKKAYDRAMAAGKYQEVLLYTGRLVKHYGTTNHKEYFAEATEAYFYRNDFYPFVAGELKQYDPFVYELFGKIWGKL
ncbi:MAG: metallopeptidase [Planctomycetaceae bacterium]|nr:metallopeptidase [Planctomycetaceae bacterium]